MFKNLLVPLDGSQLAESALPLAGFLAARLGAKVTLLHIIETGAQEEVHGERHLTDPGEACTYLEEVAAKAFPPGIEVERHVHSTETADVARGIVFHVDELAPDLIVMCTHGSGGLRDVLAGSIAQQVVARGTTPVLLVRPPEVPDPANAVRKLLVALDGNPGHEQALPVAVELARACEAELHLSFVVPTRGTLEGREAAAGRLLPGATSVMLDIARREADNYLRERMEQLRAQGLTVSAEVHRGDPASVIVEDARAEHVGMIVLGTHGKVGIDAFWSGSTTAKILARSRALLLLVPVP